MIEQQNNQTRMTNNKQVQDFRVYADAKLKLKYQILNRLGEGCFGSIYKAINRGLKKTVALKIQFHNQLDNKTANRSNLSNQIILLQKLKGIQGVPKIYGAGKWSYGIYMEMELLASSLHDEKTKNFTELQIYSMATELIIILRQIHSKSIIHQDLKPQNIMRNHQGSFVIIDFGLSTIFSPEYEMKKRGFIGTPRYACLAAHIGIMQRPKDDLESLLYVIGTMYKKKAPWFQLKCSASKRLQKIQKYKQANSIMWFKQCGNSFVTAYEYLRQLSPQKQVNYCYLIDLFQNARRKNGLKTMKIKSHYEQFQKEPSSRRNSDMAQYQISKFPTITIHLVQQNHKHTKNNKIGFGKDQHEQQSRSHNNFSQMAQDGYVELLQFLTQKIFKNLEQTNESLQQSAVISSICSREPQINNITKYQVIHFKNPFQTS